MALVLLSSVGKPRVTGNQSDGFEGSGPQGEHQSLLWLFPSVKQPPPGDSDLNGENVWNKQRIKCLLQKSRREE